ncbi:MAG: hypothetical protein H6Q40_705 [Deltaproteobacteria bacterium]|nr:hypothetical protein [Deltaproteobacteria bacterium]
MSMYEERTYRDRVRTADLINFEVMVRETDLLVRAKKDLTHETRESVLKYRHQLETYIAGRPEFQKSLIPMQDDAFAPEIAREMIRTSRVVGVGPMAAVAGAMAEFVARDLLPFSDEIIVENGGDLYLATAKERAVGIYAGSSPLSLKVGILVTPEDSPLGICTSSGTVGPSLSFGKADAVCILSKSAALADAAATAVGNLVRDKKDMESGLERAKSIEGVLGCLLILADRMGAWGNVKVARL